MIDKIARLLISKELSLDIQKVILTNYFSYLCNDEIIIKLISSKEVHPELKAFIVNLYKSPLFYSDSSIHNLVNRALELILSNPEDHDEEVVAAAIVVSTAYNNYIVINQLESFVSLTKGKENYYGPLAEYLINLITFEPSLTDQVVEKLFQIVKHERVYPNISPKLLLDIIYKHYRYHSSYRDDHSFKKLTDSLKGISQIGNFENIFRDYLKTSGCCDGICFFDINNNLKTFHYNSGFNDGYLFKQYPISLNSNKIINLAISETIPFLIEKSNENENELFNHFGKQFSNILIIPCLYYGAVNSVLVVLSNSDIDLKIYIQSFILAKYIAGAITRIEANLQVFQYYDNFFQKFSFIIKGLQHDVNHSIANIKDYLFAMENDTKIDNKNRDRFESIKKACETIDDALKHVSAYIEPSKEKKNINEVVDSVLKVLDYRINHNKIKINRLYDSDCPQIIVKPGLTTVFFNIIINAINILGEQKEKEEKIIEIRTSYDQEHIKVFIKDNGPGIKKEIKNTLFELNGPKFGKGIGLPIADHIVKVLGGKIVYVEGKNGAEFCVDMPVRSYLND